MNGEQKITSSHRERLAVVYLRQSSMAQVREHTESTTRQYGLAGEATRLGWAPGDVQVIDTDLGISGRFGVAREGFRAIRYTSPGRAAASVGVPRNPVNSVRRQSCSGASRAGRRSPLL